MMVEPAPPSALRRSVGLVLRRPVRQLGVEAFYSDFMSGLEEVLTEHRRPFVLQVVPDLDEELDAYQRWAQSGRVAGVVLVDILEQHDPRLELADRLGFASVALAHPNDAPDHAVVWVDEEAPMQTAVDYLRELGHTRIGRVSGPDSLAHTRRRTDAFESAAARLGLDARIEVADFSGAGGVAAVDRLLAAPAAPTAIVFDNDVMAAAAASELAARGVDVPGDLSLLAWDDSVLCRSTVPPLSAMARDVAALGERAGTAILQALGHDAHPVMTAPSPELIVRASTAPAR
ncbi:LacI family DNA-binding transcriptional regulator [Microbacterium testaceum]|uniref:LacI family DNA-binding transcriptional regulator n=1 Tax=Microbacterium testaceum TaxID=2033 RepID=UPI00073476AD|nr:substrate-binding domain-containing protein [Microbacterium testaceum]